MNVYELKNKAKNVFNNNSGKFLQVMLIHAILLCIFPLSILFLGADDSTGSVFVALIFVVGSLLPIISFIIPNFNPCMIRGFKGTLYEIRNNPETKSIKYISNIFRYYFKNFSVAFLNNILWYILMIVLAIACSFSFGIVGKYLNGAGGLVGSLIILGVYSPVIIVYILKNIYNLKYCFSTYLFFDDPNISITDSLKRSKQLLKNNSCTVFDILSLKCTYTIWYVLLFLITGLLGALNIPLLAIIVFIFGFEILNTIQTLAIIELYNELKLK